MLAPRVGRSAHLKRLVRSISSTLPALAEITLFALLIMAVYAAASVQLLGGSYVDAGTGESLAENFDSLPRSALSLFVLFTKDNWPVIAYPAIQEYSSWWVGNSRR